MPEASIPIVLRIVETSSACRRTPTFTLRCCRWVRAVASIQYDDGANNFVFANQRLGNVASIALTVAVPPSTSPTNYPAQSRSMLLPMQGALVGCVQAGFALAESDLALFEAGIMYFAAPANPGDPLTALRYPVFQALQARAALQFTVCLDWLTPVFVPGPNAEGSPRSFFLFTDGTVGSYFVENPGTGAFDFPTVDVATAQALGTFPGCLVLANRPFNQTTDSLYYYLTPAGLFQLSSAAGGNCPKAVFVLVHSDPVGEKIAAQESFGSFGRV